jgi:hypothetical protein
MRKSFFISIPIAVLLSLAGTAIFYNFDSSVHGNEPPYGHDENYAFGQLNVKARAVNEIGGSANINTLVDEVFNTFSVVVPADVRGRVANSETLYRNNQRGGVAEVEVVEAVNGLQIKFNTPEFSKTDLYEVRKLRQALQLSAPQLVGHGRQSEQSFVGNVNPTIVSAMSPSEAVFVLLAMIHQKKSNPNYQMTIAERNASWEVLHTTKIGQGLAADPARAGQMVNAVDAKVATMTAAEILAIPHRALDILVWMNSDSLRRRFLQPLSIWARVKSNSIPRTLTVIQTAFIRSR